MKQHYCLLVFMSIFSLCCSQTNKFDPLKGKVYVSINEIPELSTFKQVQAALLDSLDGSPYALTELRRNDTAILLLEKLHSSGSHIEFEILDILQINNLKECEVICFQKCGKDSDKDSEILALARFEESNEIFDKIYLAWRADRKAGKFYPVDTRGIGCSNYFIKD
jgi:hypothetical protein